ncbi:hypothetical protein TSUD_218360 [Trifolium subterraneum]|uniref:Reverse transcriptase domain-containing protein n=1 Tax=Trifolium subterraneum TaxID=3900 RepID=A0A2Z6NLX0_TRISU|nr:hypothetical protein TSUD_218360 [Trifolium subterraneum]
MQGTDQVAVDDVCDMGKAIGVKFKGDNANMFDILSRTGKGKFKALGRTSGGVMRKGLGGTEKRKEVRKLVGEKHPAIVCIQETKVCVCDENLVTAMWGSAPHAFSYRPSIGASGGLLTMWDSTEVEVQSTTSFEHVMLCHGRFISSNEIFYVVNVYAPCDFGAKQHLWDSLSVRLQSLAGRRVCVCGDFNVVRCLEERRSSRVGPCQSDHIPFNIFIEDNNLVDLPLGGRKFTCEENWGPRPLRMLKCWKDVPGYDLFVKEKWNSLQVDGWGGCVLKEKLKMIKAALKEWHESHVQTLPSRIDSLKTRLSDLDSKGEEEDLSGTEVADMRGITADIHSLSRLHASICWQQSKLMWLKERDANSKYFHSVLASRRRGNMISSLQADDVNLEGVDPIRQTVFMHFASHFKASNVVRPGVDNLQFKRLSWPESCSLTRPFSVEEVKAAVWDCDSFKTLFHRNDKLTKGVNSTFIALIPKVDSPQILHDFRPISLMGSMYKILAEVLANWLRLVVGSVISESQTAFVKDRQILDGILIANEVVDEARKTKKELMLFKVDFEKAYDPVDWDYLDVVMGRMSFPTLWRKWIKECICTATASILVNGSPTDTFPLERGLRQGDPLSPFLFLLAAEGLNVLMKALVENNLFTGYTVGVNIPESWLNEAASALRCNVGKIHFLYLGLSIGGDPRRLSFWEPVLTRIRNRLSGLGVRQLKEFNLALLGKWCWRMLVDKEGLWFRVLAACYGLERGRLREGGGRGSSWWREIAKIWDGVGGLGRRWFRESVVKRVGNGAEKFFWTDPCCDVFYGVGGRGRCVGLVETAVGVGGGDVEGVSDLTFKLFFSATLGEAGTLIWHKQVPSKVSICAWRLLPDRLPTRANLVSRGIISPEAHFCVSGCGGIESAQHIFSLVGLLAPYGRRFGSGLVSLRWIIITHLAISSSLLVHWASVVHDGPSCSLFGLLVCGFCGMRETISFSEIQHI